MPNRQYSSKRSVSARKTVAALLPAPCYRCGRIVTADMKWEADHTTSRVQAEALGISEVEQDRMVAPAHASCNHKHGAKLGNALKAKAKTEPRRVPQVKRPQLGFFEDTTNTPAAALQNPSLIAAQEAQDGF
jgi:hypothetical protein